MGEQFIIPSFQTDPATATATQLQLALTIIIIISRHVSPLRLVEATSASILSDGPDDGDVLTG